MSSFIQVEMSNKQLDTQISVFTHALPPGTRLAVTRSFNSGSGLLTFSSRSFGFRIGLTGDWLSFGDDAV